MIRLFLGATGGVLVVLFFAFWFAPGGAIAAEPCSRPLVVVSWYGKETCHGHPPGHGKGTCHTASDVPFDGTQWLVANKALPMGTLVRFTFNGRSIVAPVQDRGPYIPGRVFDLSRPVAVALGVIGSGTARVCAERLR